MILSSDAKKCKFRNHFLSSGLERKSKKDHKKTFMLSKKTMLKATQLIQFFILKFLEI
jgi:hypothetical protein